MLMANVQKSIIGFWFQELQPQQWFQANAGLDAQITEMFEDIYEQALSGAHDDWKENAEGALALVILLDQFPRNMYRGQAKAFVADDKALAVSHEAIHNEFDQSFSVIKRRFLYMPFMHAEDLEIQKRSLELYGAVQDIDPVGYTHAKRHYEEIERFGRFPYRNEALGRKTTPEEEEYLNTLFAKD